MISRNVLLIGTPSVLPTLGVILATLIWGSSFMVMKVALQAFDPLLIVFGRMVIASLLLLLFYKRLVASFCYAKGDWKYLLLMALCEPCFYFFFESYSLKYTTASQAGMVVALLPLLVAFVAGLFLKEKTTVTTISGFFIAVAGILLMTSHGLATKSAPNPFLGNLLEFGAMCFAAGYTTFARYLGTRYSAFFLTATQMFIGTLFFAPAVWVSSSPFPLEWPLMPSAAIIYLGSCVSIGAYGLYNYGLQKIPASQVSAYINFVPVFAVIFGWLILDEEFTMLQSCGMFLVLAGVWVSSSDLKCQKLELV